VIHLAGQSVPFSKEEMASTDLLKLLEKHGILLCVYDIICKWLKKWSRHGTDFNKMAKRSRDATVKSLSLRLGFDTLRPNTLPIFLPCANTTYQLPVFSFAAVFASMISNKQLIKEECLQFNKQGNILAPPS
jgi:hypothetical protein